MLYDAHNHLQDHRLDAERAAILQQLPQTGLAEAIVNGSAEDDWDDVALLARAHSWLRPSFGLHPWYVKERSPQWQERLRHWLTLFPEAPVGEIGLDRWIIDGLKPDDPRLAGLRVAPLAEQCEVFAAQLALGAELNRAIVERFRAAGVVYPAPMPEMRIVKG